MVLMCCMYRVYAGGWATATATTYDGWIWMWVIAYVTHAFRVHIYIYNSVITMSTIDCLVAHLWSHRCMITTIHIYIYIKNYNYNSHTTGGSALPTKVDGPASVACIHIHTCGDW